MMPAASRGSVVDNIVNKKLARNVDAKNWRMDPGEFVIYVGDSSDSVPLKQSLQM